MNALLKDGEPDLERLISTFNRCAPSVTGGLLWLDAVRFCRWPGQFLDGRKHDLRGAGPEGAARPWDGASDCRPFVVDDIINESSATLTEAFWRAMAQATTAGTEEGAYAVALVEHLIHNVLYDALVKEVELSAQYVLHYGWTVLCPRWRRELGLKRTTIKLEQLQAMAAQAQQALAGQMAQGQTGQAGMMGQGQPGQTGNPQQGMADPHMMGMAQLPGLIADPSQEQAAAEYLKAWYDDFVAQSLPEEVRAHAPEVALARAAKVVRDLRQNGVATAPLPYLAKDEPEICALKPWDEVFLPPENTTAKELVFHCEWVTDTELDQRVATESYDPAWAKLAKTFRGGSNTQPLPVGTSGQALTNLTAGGGGPIMPAPSPLGLGQGSAESGTIRIIHAVYTATDEDGVPGIYMTTFHPLIGKDASGAFQFAKHGPVESERGRLGYVEMVREWWCRSVTASRSVPEVAHTDQNLVKGSLDALVDRTSITILPPVNVYESPMGTKYKFGPAEQNYVRPGREPQFMQMPSGQGMVDGVQVHRLVSQRVDNRFGMLSEDVPQARVQTNQAISVRRYLLSWTTALQQMLWLCQRNMKDADFADITGAPAGWLDQHRDDESLLKCSLQFDVRSLDAELTMKQIEAVNKIVLPTDVMATVDRAKWPRVMMRGINPAWARELMRPVGDASQALFDKAKAEVLQMFAGNQPQFVDGNDPTAGSLLQFTLQIVTANPVYLKALDDPALAAVAGQNATALAQQIGPRHPDPRFSALLVKWLQNLKFVGVTQVQNKQTGRIGVNPDEGVPAGPGQQ